MSIKIIQENALDDIQTVAHDWFENRLHEDEALTEISRILDNYETSKERLNGQILSNKKRHS